MKRTISVQCSRGKLSLQRMTRITTYLPFPFRLFEAIHGHLGNRGPRGAAWHLSLASAPLACQCVAQSSGLGTFRSLPAASGQRNAWARSGTSTPSARRFLTRCAPVRTCKRRLMGTMQSDHIVYSCREDLKSQKKGGQGCSRRMQMGTMMHVGSVGRDVAIWGDVSPGAIAWLTDPEITP